MHKEILTQAQVGLLPVLKKFKDDFGLVGGTAIALHIGHRESIDFDMFSPGEFDNAKIRRRLASAGKKPDTIIRDEAGQFTLITDGVHMTFFEYPFPIEYSESFEDWLRLPTLLTLGAMKAFALGRRSKWKDYVDLYFIMSNHHSLEDISRKAEDLFGREYNAKLFREQISYFDDVSYKEEVVYKPGFEVPDEEVQRALIEHSLS